MKKMRLILVTILTIMTLAVLGTYQNQSASAKAKYTTTFPKSMRGTWYKYNKRMHLIKYVIKKHSCKGDYWGGPSITPKLKKPLTKKQKNEAYNGLVDAELGHPHTKRHRLAMSGLKNIYGKYLQRHNQKWLFIEQRYVQSGIPSNAFLRIGKKNGHSELLVMHKWENMTPISHFERTKKLAKKLIDKKLRSQEYWF